MKDINLGCNIMPGVLSESECLVWMILKFGIQFTFRLIMCYNALPTSLTDQQKLSYLKGVVDPSETAGGISALLDILVSKCPTVCAEMSQESIVPCVLAAPVSHCLECNDRLVSYHACKVGYYTTVGVKNADKVTLRCIRCQLFYSYSQFGSKKDGFRFYPNTLQQVAVEATDGVLVHRSLAEWHCSLA